MDIAEGRTASDELSDLATACANARDSLNTAIIELVDAATSRTGSYNVCEGWVYMDCIEKMEEIQRRSEWT